MRVVRLFNKACGDQIGEQIGGEQITVIPCIDQNTNVTFNPNAHAYH